MNRPTEREREDESGVAATAEQLSSAKAHLPSSFCRSLTLSFFRATEEAEVKRPDNDKGQEARKRQGEEQARFD